ncbi:hypothetical protein BH23GEM2_BH23GEM2_12810 [soil metagenome]
MSAKLPVAALAAAAALALSGCVAIVESPVDSHTNVAVRVAQGTVIAEMSPLTDFRVPVEITNLGPRWVLYDRWCEWRIEQYVNGRWVAAYYPYCTVDSQEYHSIPPGSTYYESLPAHRSWRVGNGAGVEGTYRVVFPVYEEIDVGHHVQLREDRTSSNPFHVRR